MTNGDDYIEPTHEVIDLIYTEEEGNVAFVGSYEECIEWQSEHEFGYVVQSII